MQRPPLRICGDCGKQYRAWQSNQPCPDCLIDSQLDNRKTLAEMAREARLERRRKSVDSPGNP